MRASTLVQATIQLFRPRRLANTGSIATSTMRSASIQQSLRLRDDNTIDSRKFTTSLRSPVIPNGISTSTPGSRDRVWRDVGPRRQAPYDHLPPGGLAFGEGLERQRGQVRMK